MSNPIHVKRQRLLYLMAILAGMGGFGGAIALIAESGFHRVFALLVAVQWGFLWLIPVRFIAVSLNAQAWRTLLRAWIRLGLPFVVWVALVRDAVNNLLPVFRVGGDAAGLRLLVHRGLGAEPTAATIVVETTTTIFVQIAFSLLGLSLLLSYVHHGPLVTEIVEGVGVAAAVAVVFLIVQTRGRLFSKIEKIFIWLRGRGFKDGTRGPVIDEAITNLYRQRSLVVGCGLWQLLSIFGGACEVWVIFHILGVDASARLSVLFESMIQGLQSAAFIVPGALGIQEGGLVAVGMVAGVPMDVALAVSLIRRLRQIAFGVPVLATWVHMEHRWKNGRRVHAEVESA